MGRAHEPFLDGCAAGWWRTWAGRRRRLYSWMFRADSAINSPVRAMHLSIWSERQTAATSVQPAVLGVRSHAP
jgi:hypothetical protein